MIFNSSLFIFIIKSIRKGYLMRELCAFFIFINTEKITVIRMCVFKRVPLAETIKVTIFLIINHFCVAMKQCVFTNLLFNNLIWFWHVRKYTELKKEMLDHVYFIKKLHIYENIPLNKLYLHICTSEQAIFINENIPLNKLNIHIYLWISYIYI